jgi:hypothetical protein
MSSHFRNSHVRTSANTTNNCPFSGVMTSGYMGTACNRGQIQLPKRKRENSVKII